MTYTFHEMFTRHFPKEMKAVKTLSELVYNFERWTGRRATRLQRWALEDEAKELGIKGYGK